MALSTSDRWFEQEQMNQAARSLMAEVAEACHANRQENKESRYSTRQLATLNTQTKWFIAGIATLFAAILLLPSWLPGDWLAKNNNLQVVVRWIVIIVPLGFGVAAKNRLRRAARTDVHDSCVEKLIRQFPKLRDANLARMIGPSVDVLPRLAADCEPILRCSLFGEFRSHALAMFETDYTATTSLDAKQLLDRAQAKILADPDKAQFSRTRTAEAIVFFQPQPRLPDLFLAGKEEPLSSCQSRWVKDAGGAVRQSRVSTPLGAKVEAFSSCPDLAAQFLCSPALTELLLLRPGSLVQVIGGFVVVVPRSWSSATPMETAVAAFEVQLDLEFACAVYDALAGAKADRHSPQRDRAVVVPTT